MLLISLIIALHETDIPDMHLRKEAYYNFTMTCNAYRPSSLTWGTCLSLAYFIPYTFNKKTADK